MNRDTIFYIDPQSMLNLARYDYHLLGGVRMSVHYFCSKYYDFHPIPNVIPHKVFKYNHKRYSWQKALSYTVSWMIILWLVLRLRPKVVHIQWFRIPRFDYVIVRIMQQILGIKVLFTAHNVLPHQGNEQKQTDVFRCAYHAFNSIIVHSEKTKNEIVKCFNVPSHKVEVIRHGILPIDVDIHRYEALCMDYDCRYAHLKEKIVFAALGYQNYYKGTDLLMQVWAGTAELRNNPNIALIIIGKVNDSRINLSILDGVSNAICQNRRISDEEYLYLLRHTDVYLLPYREISQSGAMLTVLSEHVPMLLSDVGSLAEPLDVAPIGWKIKSDDSDELRDALLHLTHNPDEIRRIKEDKVSWEHLRQFYDWHEISRQTESIYKKLCSF